MRILLAVALIMAVPAAATAADDRSSDSGSPVGRPRTFIYEQFPGEGQAWIDNYQYDRAIREQEREEQKQWTDYARKHALPIARPDEAPIENEGPIAEKAPGDSGPTNTQEPGFRVVHPPGTTSSTASDKVPDLAERFSFDGPPPRRRERLW